MTNLTRLTSFVAVADELNFSRAAERLHISQPALSQRINLLEQEIGTELLVRSSRNVMLTMAGMQVFADARELLSRASQLERRARSAADGGRGYLSLGFSPDYTWGPLTHLLAEFQSSRRSVRIQSCLDVSQTLADDVATNQLDVAFLTPPLPSHTDSLATFDLPSVEMVGILTKEHREAGQPEIDLKQLAGDRFVLSRPNIWTGYYMQVTALFDEAGFVPDVIHEVESPPMQLELVTEGVGVALATENSIDRSRPELVFPRLRSPNARVRQSIVWRHDNQSPILRELLDMMQTEWSQ
jgi:DNA-binding transcriptional LysR family regulator